MDAQVLAYFDPVSGSIILQLIISGVLGGGIFFRRWIGRVVRAVLPNNKGDAGDP